MRSAGCDTGRRHNRAGSLMFRILLSALQIAVPGPTIAVPMDQDFQVEGRWLPLSACAAGPSSSAHIRIGVETFEFPATQVKSFTVADVNATGNLDEPGVMNLNLPATAGCPETPLDAMVLAIDPEVDALPSGLLVAAIAPGATSGQMAALRDSGRCDGESLPGFVACNGSIGVGDDQVEVVALITLTGVSSDGGALFAVCEGRDGQPLCEVQGGRESLSYKGVLAPGLPTIEAISAADAAALDLLRR